MSPRRVRFDLGASPASTSESSLGPVTPPQYARSLVSAEGAPQTVSPSPSPASPNQSQLHRALIKPTFDFDVSIHPLFNHSICSDIELQKELNLSMTELYTRSLILQSRHLPWQITISTDSNSLTALDSLVGIYNNLRIRATQAEFDLQSQKKRDEISAAFYDRIQRRTLPEFREQERCKGLRRVDFLPLNALHFNGLDVGKGSDPWIMHSRR